MRAWILVAVALLALAAWPPTTAGAEDLCRPLAVFAKNDRAPVAANPQGFACLGSDLANAPPAGDARILAPGTTVLSVRYAASSVGVDTLTARVDGLGFHDANVVLTLSASGGQYDSPFLPYSGSGRLDVTLSLPDGSVESTTYRTVDA